MSDYEWQYIPENAIPNMPPPQVMRPVLTQTIKQAAASPSTVNTIKYPKVGLMDVVLFLVVMHYLKKSVENLFPDKIKVT